MKFRNTLILFGVVVALFIFVYFFEIRKPEETGGKSRDLGDVLLLEKEDINQIELKYADPEYEGIVCSRDDGGQWHIEQPLEANADQKIMDSMISTVMSRNVFETLKNPGGLDEYGLNPPRVTVRLQSRDGASRTLLLGNTVPTGNYVYIKQGSTPDISLVPASIVDDLTRFVSDLRDRTIITLDSAEILRIRLEYAGGESIVCEKKGLQWELIEPIAAEADASAVDKLISDLNGLKVDRFADEDPGDLSVYGLAQPRIKVVASFRDGEKALLLGEDKDGRIYVKTASGKPVFLVAPGTVDKLTKRASDLRDKTIIAFDKSVVEKLEIKHSECTVVLQRRSDPEEEWDMVAPMTAKADKERIDEALQKLSGLKADDFASDKSGDISNYGLAQPETQITISLKGSEPKSLLVGKKVKESVYVKTASAATVYLVDAEIMSDFTRESLYFRDSQVMEFDRDNVKRIELKRKDETIACIKQEHDWRIVEPVREKAKNYEIIDILRKLDSLEAEKFITEKAGKLSEYGLDQPVLKAVITLEDDSTKILLVGGELPDSASSYAKTADEDVIFTIKKDVVDELNKGLDKIRE